MRDAKGLQSKSHSHTVTELGNGRYTVTSGASGKSYTVTLSAEGDRCNCNWAAYRPSSNPRCACSHTIAARDYAAAKANYRVAWATAEQAQRQHRHTEPVGDGLILTLRKNAA